MTKKFQTQSDDAKQYERIQTDLIQAIWDTIDQLIAAQKKAQSQLRELQSAQQRTTRRNW